MTNTTTATRQRTDTSGIALIDRALALSNDDDHPAGLIWGLRAVNPDLRSRNGFRWGWPGTWVSVPGETCDGGPVGHEGKGVCTANTTACPYHEGDGLCVAKTWRGMASGGIRATTLLVVGWQPEDLLAEDDEKARVRRAYVRDVIDGARLVRMYGSHADLRGAILSGADLAGANLSHANLSGADLPYAYLSYADLSGADLSRAYLSNTNLSYADLSHADLTGADLSHANLTGADLSHADLSYVDLSYADLSHAELPNANLPSASLWGANLSGAGLSGANLRNASLSGASLSGTNLSSANLEDATLWDVNLSRANLRDAVHNARTRWPDGWDADRIAQEVNR